MPLFHIGALGVAVAQNFRGGTIYRYRQFEPQAMLDCIETEQITTLHVAPVMVQMLMDFPTIEEADVTSVHTAIYSAAPMPSPLLTSIGIPFANTEVRVVDENENDCPTGEAGELLIKSTAMFRGYWNNNTASIETLRGGWCHTGDIVKQDENSFLYLVDRKKDMIISGGENIYSREVEEAVLQHESVSEVAVIGVPDEKWDESVCAIVILKQGKQVTEQELIDHTKTLIASYKKTQDCLLYR